MKAVILAAGIASRLRPLTDTTPKCLLKIGERCLLERAFDALIQNGFDEFIIVTGYRQQQIVDFLQAHYPTQDITFIYNDRYESTNNIYSLWLTRSYTDGQEILLLDSDIVFDPQIVEKLLHSDKDDILANIFYERAFERLIPQGYSFYVMDTTEFFSAELDTVEDFQQAQKLIPASLY